MEKRMYTEHFDRITHNPAVMGGKPCIRGMRVTVGMIINQIGAGHSIEEVLANYPYLEREDILQALRYAAWRVETTNPLSNPKAEPYSGPRRLTRQEIESLRQDRKEDVAWFREAFKDIKGTLAPKK